MLQHQGDGLTVAQVHDGQRVGDFGDQPGFEPRNGPERLQRLEPVRGRLLVRDIDMGLGTAKAVSVVVLLEAGGNRAVGCRLQPAVDGGDHLVPALVGRCHAKFFQGFDAHHLGNVGRRNLGDRAVVVGPVRFCDGSLELGPLDETQFEHPVEHVVAPLQRPLRRGDRVDSRRRLGQRRDHRALRQRQLPGGLPVIDLGGGAHAVGPVAEENLVHVKLEDLVLLQFAFDAQGQKYFLDLAREGLFRGEEEVTRELLRDRAAADGLFAGGEQRQRRPGDALVVDAGMLVEAGVVARDERLLHAVRRFVDGNGDAPLLPENADQSPVLGEHP